MSTALLMMASGLSQRFGGDKLMADLGGQSVAAHTARLGMGYTRHVILPPDSPRADIYKEWGWRRIVNPDPAAGQGHALAFAVRRIAVTDADALIICLADMPFITDAHLQRLTEASTGVHAVMSDTGEALTPPALFKRAAFPVLGELAGDAGARALFNATELRATVPLSPRDARDVDTPEMLAALNEETPYA